MQGLEGGHLLTELVLAKLQILHQVLQGMGGLLAHGYDSFWLPMEGMLGPSWGGDFRETAPSLLFGRMRSWSV